MGDCGDLLLGLADEVRIAEVTLAVMRLEAADVGILADRQNNFIGGYFYFAGNRAMFKGDGFTIDIDWHIAVDNRYAEGLGIA